MTRTGYVCNASIGRDVLNNTLDGLDLDYETVLARALTLFESDERTSNIEWVPSLSELVIIDINDAIDETLDAVEFAKMCFDQAIHELLNI